MTVINIAIERQLQEAERQFAEAQRAFAALPQEDLARSITIHASLLTSPYKQYGDAMAGIQKALGRLAPEAIKEQAEEAYRGGGQGAEKGIRELLEAVTKTHADLETRVAPPPSMRCRSMT